MKDPINAVYSDIKAALDPVPLYHDPEKLNRQAPAMPHALFQYVAEPADPPSRYFHASALMFGVDVRGPKNDLLEIAENLEWLRAHYVGNYGNASNLRYRLWTRSMNREPETLMPNGVTPVYNLSTTYRVEYQNFAPHIALEVPP